MNTPQQFKEQWPRVAFATLMLSSALIVAPADAQISARPPIDTGVRNTLPGRPMGTPRSAGGMQGMPNMPGMSAMPNMSSMSSGSSMPGMASMAGTPMGSDSSGQGTMDLQMRLMAVLELNARLMADPAIRQRVMSDSALRGLALQASGASGAMAMPGMNMGGHGGMDMSTHGSMSGQMPAGMDMSHGANRAQTAQPASTRKATAAWKTSRSTTAKKAAPMKAPAKAAPAKPAAKKPMPPMPGMPGMKMP